MTSSAPDRTAAAKMRLRPSERDMDVLTGLSDYRFLSIPQLTALYYPSKGSCEARMRVLFRSGLAHRVFVPARPYDRKTHTIYALSKAGAQVLGRTRHVPSPVHLSDRERRSALFLDHTLRRNDVRICLELLAREDPGFQLLTWRQRPEDIRSEATIRWGRRTERVPIIPDGYFAVRLGRDVQAFAVEIDMGTVSVERMEKRYRAYWKWHRSGGHRLRYGRAPLRVLTLTTTDAHLKALRDAAARAPETTASSGSGLFWFTRLDSADIELPETLLSPVWTVARPNPGPPRPLFDS